METVCLLSNRKSKPDSYVDLSINMEDYHRIKNEEKVLEKELLGYAEYKERVKYKVIPFVW